MAFDLSFAAMQHSASDVRVSRRLALHGCWALPALAALERVARHPRARAQDGDVEAFLQRWLEESQALVAADDPNEDRYLHRLCADLAALDPTGFPPRRAIAFEQDGVRSGPVFPNMPFLVLQFDLEPGAVIRAHNHVGWSFLSMGVRGEATVRHFETLPGAPAPASDLETEFRVRETSSTLLTRGRGSSLTRSRDNIHWFRAGEEGATFLDFGVHLEEPGDGPEAFSVLEFDPEPVDAERRVHTARWLGNVYAKD